MRLHTVAEYATGGSENNSALAPFKERSTDLAFESLDLSRQSGLRQVKLSGGFPHAPDFGDHEKTVNDVQIHEPTVMRLFSRKSTRAIAGQVASRKTFRASTGTESPRRQDVNAITPTADVSTSHAS